MSDFKEKMKQFLLLTDEEEPMNIKEDEDKVIKHSQQELTMRNQESHPFKKSRGENVVSIHQKQPIQKPRITVVEPRMYSEVQEVSDVLLDNQSVIINFRRMDTKQATKMIDFLMGVTYAIKGDIQRLGEEIFICTPQSVEVSGSELSEFTESLV